MKPAPSQKNGRFTFFREFLKHPLQVASIVPSSSFLEKRILEAASIDSAATIVELGSGTGGTTRAILHSMPKHAKLLSIEINPHFHSLLASIEDNRLITHLGNACMIKEIISMYGLPAPDVIISGIPFSTLDHVEACRVIEAVSSLLAPEGRFVAYQVSRRITSLCHPFLGAGQIKVELLNIPPMHVYRWQKKVPDTV